MNHYADKVSGKYLFGTDGTAPENSVLVPAPNSIHDIWDGEHWSTPVDVLVTDAKARLNDDFDRAMAGLHTGWPDYETQTWTVQAEEAKQWTAAPDDAKPSVPFLAALHAQREAMGWVGTLGDLVDSVMKNTIAYTAATATLIARRHVAERAIDEAEDPSSVTWSFAL